MSRESHRGRLSAERLDGAEVTRLLALTGHSGSLTGTRVGIGLIATRGRRHELIAAVVIGRPADPDLADGRTGRLLIFAPAGTTTPMRRILLAAAWQVATAMGYQRLVGCTGGDEPHPGACVELRSGSGRRRDRKPHTGRRITRRLWVCALPKAGEHR